MDYKPYKPTNLGFADVFKWGIPLVEEATGWGGESTNFILWGLSNSKWQTAARNAIKLKVAVTVYARTVLPMAWAPRSPSIYKGRFSNTASISGSIVDVPMVKSCQIHHFRIHGESLENLRPVDREVKALASPLIKEFISLNAFNKAGWEMDVAPKIEARETRNISRLGLDNARHICPKGLEWSIKPSVRLSYISAFSSC